MTEDTNDMESTHVNMTEDINDMQSTHVKMSSEEFEAKLTDFFTKHKQSKLNLASRIAFEFIGHEAFVLEHLHNKYVLGIVAQKPQKNIAHKSEQHDEYPKNIESAEAKNIESAEAKKPKSKKKLIMFIIIGVVVVGLGVTGFMMKDKLMGMIGKGHETEHGAVKSETVGESPAAGAKPKKEEVAPKEEVVDTTKQLPLIQ